MIMNTLRLQLRFLVPLLLALVATAYLSLPLMDRLTLKWFSRDLNLRDELVTNSLSDSIADALRDNNLERLGASFDRVSRDERLVAIGLCTLANDFILRSKAFPIDVSCAHARELAGHVYPQVDIAGGPVHVGVHSINGPDGPMANLALLHDLSFAGARALLGGGGIPQAPDGASGELAPLAADLRARLRDLEDEFRRSLGPEREWTPERLRSLLHTQLRGDEVIVVSNREPYIHDYDSGHIVVRRPASGLVTAVEPVVQACSGTWIAHGSGAADRDVIDASDRIRVPPGHEAYTLRRIWLSADEEEGYYYGFANEGLWPLCHVAHVRPVFREADWQRYREVNARFADAVVNEARSEDPVVLVQDYHFALLPALISARLPRATIITFWHIPWPNPESFGICPWRREILQGMLGSTILGFHTRFHCKNFIETVDRYLEARIEHEHSVISYKSDQTLVESYPISIAWPSDQTVAAWPSPALCRERVFARLGLGVETRLAIGVDRFDYTKGILERLNAVERLLEKRPEWRGRCVFVQIAAPSRSSLEEYRNFQQRIEAQSVRINERFQSPGYRPIVLIAQHHEHAALTELYRAADVCLVTSLHDGMNLVCKEFVAARDDERGVLILSRFAGAAREMTEALIVNPYHVEESADALHQALVMPEAEQRERMASLRMTVREYNVYRWAGRMLADASRTRLRQRIEARVERHRGQA
ncbi:MAG: trehalose-6-phosphate synthase [Gammaproteobacteria bacterium]|nr:trehalose-6-phosphate synthase [Gammaproteobacteria bacterium]